MEGVLKQMFKAKDNVHCEFHATTNNKIEMNT